MATWIVGDVHGCASELAALLASIAPGPDDRVLCAGDLLHRGPDPAGVVDLLVEHRAGFVLGNHELAVLRRLGLAPRGTAPDDRPPLRAAFPPLEAEDLDGDGGTPCHAPPERRADLARFLQRHDGFWIESGGLGSGPCADGRPWWLVHAGVEPGRALGAQRVETLTRVRRLAGPGRPMWHEAWRGPALVVFGHTPSREPVRREVGGRLVALGLDTGCVYGGALTAYSPELDRFASVPAARDWVTSLARSA